MILFKIIFLILILNVTFIYAINNTNTTCPYPLKYRERTGSYSVDNDIDYNEGYAYNGGSNNTDCLIPCPGPIYSKDNLSKLSYLSKISGTICFFSSVIVLIIYSPIINRLGYNRKIYSIIFLSFGIFCITLTDVIYFGKGDSLICKDSHRYARQSDALCGLTGVLFQFGSLSAIFWWTLLVLDLYLTLKNNTQSKFDKYFGIIVNIIILFLTFIPFARHGYGYYVTGITCWILDSNDSMFFFWDVYIVLLVIGTILIVMISYRIYHLSKEQRIKESIGTKQLIRSLILIIFIWVQFILLLSFNATIGLNIDKYNEKMENWVDCVLTTKDYKKCSLKTFPFDLEFSVLFFLRFIGFELLLFFTILMPNHTIKILQSNNLIKKLFFKNSNNNGQFLSFNDNEYSLNNFNTNNNNNNNNNNHISNKFVLKQ